MSATTNLFQPTHDLTVINSTKINKKVTQILSALFPASPDHPPDSAENTIVQITARSRAASKLITVVEIVKREVVARLAKETKKKGRKLWQYSTVFGQTLEPKQAPVKVLFSKEVKGTQQERADRSESPRDEAEEVGVMEERQSRKRKAPPADATSELEEGEEDEREYFETLAPGTKRLCVAADPEVGKKPVEEAMLRIVLAWRAVEGCSGWGVQVVP